MKQKILKLKIIYKFFFVLTLVCFIDVIIVPILISNLQINYPQDVGLAPLFFGYLFGSFGIGIGVWITTLWFVWGLIAHILNKLIKKLEKGIK